MQQAPSARAARSRVTPRLLTLRVRKRPLFSGWGTSPGKGPRRRAGSPTPGRSTFTTSAPYDASSRVHTGPATRFERSTTRTSSSGPVTLVSSNAASVAVLRGTSSWFAGGLSNGGRGWQASIRRRRLSGGPSSQSPPVGRPLCDGSGCGGTGASRSAPTGEGAAGFDRGWWCSGAGSARPQSLPEGGRFKGRRYGMSISSRGACCCLPSMSVSSGLPAMTSRGMVTLMAEAGS